jgi:small ligand-binding sensory domain FIST
VRLCSEIREHLDEQGRSGRAEAGAKGAIYVSCLGRGSNMFGEPGEEARLIQSQLGDIPLVGFSAAGEIGGSRLYGFTGVLTVFY